MRSVISLLVLCSISIISFSQAVHIIPQPVSIKTLKGKFIISKNTVLAARDEQDRKTANLFNDYLENIYGFRLDVDKQDSKNYIRLTTKKFIRAPEKDAYTLNVNSNGVSIEGDTYAATFYGMQSLIQLLPVENLQSSSSSIKTSKQLEIQFVSIQDYPRFKYRGLHLDVGRHFSPPSFVKKYIDYIALHKMNYFHWHLTEDQGWRIEIKKYPNLTSIGGFRNGTIIGRNPGTGNDNLRYGGFYTQDEVKEIVQYAADRHITVIPEIEMPGHSSAAIAAYPWLSCFPEQPTRMTANASDKSKQSTGKLLQESWGVFDDVYCAGKDSTFLFLQDVLDEVLTLFPSKYIHVGGDESPKAHWKKCPNCQSRIKKLNLKDEHELQSYFIQRMEKYLNAKGRTLIGWDEILEGGLAPNAIVMSWRGEKGGIEAANQNHNVIMTPEKPMYLDHTQSRNEDSVTIGGYNPIEAMYAYDPLPKELSAEKAKYILGAQANLWTEYIKNPSKVEYMIFPRVSALSEVLWSQKSKKNWIDFEKRMQTQFKRYDLWKVNYSKAYYSLRGTILPTKDYNGVIWKLETALKDGKIRFRDDLQNSKYINYTMPLTITKDINYTATLFKNNEEFTSPIIQSFHFNRATGTKATIKTPPNERYPGQGAFSLVNGIYSNKSISFPDWIAWIGDDMEAVIDLGKSTIMNKVSVHTLNQNESRIYLPEYVEVFTSNDGKKYTSVGKSSEFVSDTLRTGWITVNFEKKQARFVKVIAKNFGVIPAGKAGEGIKAWLFADEIQVY
ncbi:MAG: beta-N-acetylhexosaminidase [Flavisolibacter sp.]